MFAPHPVGLMPTEPVTPTRSPEVAAPAEAREGGSRLL